MKKIAILTSGGDSPGMNACIRAAVRTALYNKVEVMGALRGYDGLVNNQFIPLESKSVANIIQRGGPKRSVSNQRRKIESGGESPKKRD